MEVYESLAVNNNFSQSGGLFGDIPLSPLFSLAISKAGYLPSPLNFTPNRSTFSIKHVATVSRVS